MVCERRGPVPTPLFYPMDGADSPPYVPGRRIGQRGRGGLGLGTAGIEVALEQDLRGELVAQALAAAPVQTGGDQ